MNKVEHWYDNEYDEWKRLERHKIEFDITKRYLDKYIIGENLEVTKKNQEEKRNIRAISWKCIRTRAI